MKIHYQALGAGLLVLFFHMGTAGAVTSSYDRNSVVPVVSGVTPAEQYEMSSASKLERGMENFFLGWLEIPHGIKSEYYYRRQRSLDGGIEPFFIGTLRGTLNAVGRTAVGFYETVFFLIPQDPILEDMSQWLY